MRFPEKTYIGKNGTCYTLRSPEAADAEKLLRYLKTTAKETYYLLNSPGEREIPLKQEEAFLEKLLAEPRAVMVSAFEGELLAGNASLTCVRDRQKTAHRAYVAIALVKRAWGQGLGTRLMEELIAFGRQEGYEQIELGVFSDNLPAIRLYRKLGFEICGELPHAFRLGDGTYRSEVLMVLTL